MNNKSVNSAFPSGLVPSLALCILFGAVLLTALRLIGYGYLPADDALRHSAKVVSGRDWSEILVLRPEITMDSHPGWHYLLTAVHRVTGAGPRHLVIFSVVVLFVLFSLPPVLKLRRPESWLIAMGIAFLANPSFMHRLLLGRPFIVTMTALSYILLVWPRLEKERFPVLTIIGLAVVVALSTWIHCGWYLFALPLICFALARQWRAAAWLAAATVVGVIIGAALTGAPVSFLFQTITHLRLSLGEHSVVGQLVTEFQPFDGNAPMIFALAGLLIWRRLWGEWEWRRLDNPVFILIALGWILGFRVHRFWLDWGMVAAVVWITQEFQDYMTAKLDDGAFRRLLFSGVMALIFFSMVTSNLRGRWTSALNIQYLSPDNPDHRPWLPETGGIIYSADMFVFYQTFFKNPSADWRYIMGFEPALMPEKDLAVLRNIQMNYYDDPTFSPWVEKMRPQDRLMIRRAGTSPPKIPQLSWHYPVTGIWVGKLPESSQ